MTLLLEFISSILDGIALAGIALALGGVVFCVVILRAMATQDETQQQLSGMCLRAVAASALLVALIRFAQTLLTPWALVVNVGTLDLSRYMATSVFQHQAISGLMSLALAILSWRASRSNAGPVLWCGIAIACAAFLVNEAWLSHAVSRIDETAFLMSLTMLHVTGAVVWSGGVGHLLLVRRFCVRNPAAIGLWPIALARFSPLGIVSVVIILLPGSLLAIDYVGEWNGLFGTGYGNMVLVKIALLAVVLLLAASNFLNTRRWRLLGDSDKIQQQVPAFVEAECALAIAILFSAAALTSFPPAIDTPGDTATAQEMWRMFEPKTPRLNGPQIVIVEAPQKTDVTTGEMGVEEYLDWDNFNHNISGVLVIIMGLMALLERLTRIAWMRHWPLIFMAFGVLIMLVANPGHWPLGRRGFIESVQDAEVIQHWLAALVAFALGLFEWLARRDFFHDKRWSLVFPLLCVTGGIILLTHSHGTFELKSEFLIQSTHMAMGYCAVILGCGRWLELRLPHSNGKLHGLIAAGAMLCVGLILLFYADPATLPPLS